MIRSRTHSCLLVALAAGACLIATTHARADTSQAMARTLFDEARQLIADGNVPQACLKFAESMRLDPKGGTLLNLAVCHEKEGKTATAWLELRDALGMARKEGRVDREELAQNHISAIEPSLSRLTIAVAPENTTIEWLQIKLDNVVIGQAAWGTAMVVDPGSHLVEALAPRKRKWSSSVDIGPNADRKQVEVPVLEPDPSATEPVRSVVVPVVPPADSSSSPPPPMHESSRSSRPTVGYVLGGTGILLAGVGGYFGLQAISKWKDAKETHCPNGVCDSQAPGLSKDANTSAWIANVGIGLGLVCVGIGTWLIVSGSSGAPPRTGRVRAAPLVGRDLGGVSLAGAW